MGWRGTLALSVALLLASASLYYDASRDRPSDLWRAVVEGRLTPAPGTGVPPLLSFDASTVTAITLQHEGKTVRTERTPDGWTGTGRPDEVNAFLVELAAQAEILRMERGTAAPQDHGLDPPQATIELQRRNEPPIIVLIGSRNPPRTALYVQLGPGGPIVLTGALLLWNVSKLEHRLADVPAESASF